MINGATNHWIFFSEQAQQATRHSGTLSGVTGDILNVLIEMLQHG
ncbi:hypothetical Protein YC6258_04243 [Gynuella sunshinyii YC6258]|uniref:Uncharacterized protein n=1 Tax=Gynuella sunshinyii YC6258 TaxID=1445510 RepID=A0A0C5VNN6_9GAMM|nr:hypothetical Protein YC6258_04243 [Gynuella sunshinyii YC6258]